MLPYSGICFENLGNQYKNKIEHFGAKEGFDQEGTLVMLCEEGADIKSEWVRTGKDKMKWIKIVREVAYCFAYCYMRVIFVQK